MTAIKQVQLLENNELCYSACSNYKLIGPELLRFLLVLLVLAWHYQHFFYLNYQPVDFIREQQPLYSVLFLAYNAVWRVPIFWCLSGFLLFYKYRIPIATRQTKGSTFFIARFARLYPLHLITLLLVAFFQIIYFSKNDFFFIYKYNDFKHLILQLLLAGSWGFEEGYSFNGPSWSMSVEVLVYIIFFMLLRYLGKSFLGL